MVREDRADVVGGPGPVPKKVCAPVATKMLPTDSNMLFVVTINPKSFQHIFLADSNFIKAPKMALKILDMLDLLRKRYKHDSETVILA